MRLKRAAASAVIAATALLASPATPAQADPCCVTTINVSYGHGVGMYSAPSISPKLWYDLQDNGYDRLYALCWVVGQQIGNYGDVWYKTLWAASRQWGDSPYFDPPAYTFAPYVDGAAAFHNGLPQCS